MFTLRKFVLLILALFLAAFGISLQMKAAIGIAPFDAMNQSLAYLFDARVGDVVTIVQLLFVVFQILILKKDTNWRIFLQVLVGALLGQFVNLFYYNVFGDLVVENYIIRFLLLLFGSFWVPIFIGAVMVLDLVTMPVENFSMVLSRQINRPFGQVRQMVDIACLVIALGITFIFNEPFTIREGTIVSALTFGPLLSVYMPIIEKYFVQWNVMEPVNE